MERVDPKTNRTVYVQVGTILWPTGTRHDASRFNGSFSCNACGHAIKNPYNWVPLLLDDAQGVPHSLWVGRDCAQRLFGVVMEGDAEYTSRE